MTTQDDTTWPQVGDEVVVLTSTPGTSYQTATRDTVKRITRTVITLTKDPKTYRVDDRRSRGDTTWGPSSTLVRLDDPSAAACFGRQARGNAVRAVAEILKRWREDEDPFNDVYDAEIRITLARYRPIIDRYASPDS